MLGLRFRARAFSSCGERGPLFIAVRRPLTVGPLLLRSTGSRCAGSVVVTHGPSCSTACGIFPDQGSNPRPLHWQADSQPLRHQGSPKLNFYMHWETKKFVTRFTAMFALLRYLLHHGGLESNPQLSPRDACIYINRWVKFKLI